MAVPAGHHKTAAEVAAKVDLTGKVAIVTGASSGIGIETAAVLVSRGAHVFLAVRDLNKVAPVLDDIKKRTRSDKVEALRLDLESFKSIREFASAFLARGLPLHLLINNAGIMATPYGKTEDGWELQFGTNHLGHFLLTSLLTPTLLKSAPARVVNLTSVANKWGNVNWKDINFENNYEKWASYAQAKTANILFTVEYNKRYSSQGVTANAVHPGGIRTGLQWNVPEEEQKAAGWESKLTWKTIEEGAATSVWAAVAPELEGNGGHYCEDCSISGPDNTFGELYGCTPQSLDEQAAFRLWELSEAAVKGEKTVSELVAAEREKEQEKSN